MVTYRYLSTNTYEVTFKVYRDCNSNTPFDGDNSSGGGGGGGQSLFYYTLFDNATGGVATSRSLKLKSKSTVSSAIKNPCVDTTVACAEEGLYMDTITVPNGSKWYSIVHQRCCRNNSINNLTPNTGGGGGGGGSVYPGMTIYTNIPPSSTYSNNSAKFKNFPPLFICRNQQFNFDHSAIDADGDLLKYYLVTPLDGGTGNNPVPTVATFAKTPVNWQTPYSLSNIIGGTPNLAIDELTGLLTCKPDVSGRYVVSVLVKEFRGGVCIDSSIRDFQFNVNDCGIPKSDLSFIPGTFDLTTGIGDYIVNCNSKTVNFANTSTNATNYVWHFGEPSSGVNDTSTLMNPSHTYSDTGTYIISLVSYQTGLIECADTVRRRVKIYPTYQANFSFPTTPPACKGAKFNFTDKSIGTYGVVNKWTWDFGDASAVDTTQNPSHTYANAGTYDVKLISENSKKCVDDTTIRVTVNPSPTINAIFSNACIGQSMTLNCNLTVSTGNILNKKWTLPDRTDTACNTTYTPPTMASFTVQLWAQSDKGCVDSQSFTISVNPLPTITASSDTTICYDQKAQLWVTGGVSYLWTPASQLSSSTSSTPLASPIYPNSSKYIVKGIDSKGCYNFDSTVVSFHNKPFISAGLDTNVCLNPSPFKYRDSVQLNGQGNFSTVFWTPATGLDNPNIKTPKSKPRATLDYIFNGIDQYGCIVKDTVNVLVLDPNFDLIPSKDVSKCIYDTITINPLDQGIISKYVWSPNIWISNNLKRNPQFFSRDTTLYILYVENYCYNKYDSIRVDAIPYPSMGLPRIDSMCNGEIYRFNLNPAYTYTWNSPDLTLSSRNSFNPTCSPSTTVKYYYVTAVDNFGCRKNDSMELIVNYPPNVTILGKPRFLCQGDSVKLSVVTNLNSWVKWYDNTYISNDSAKETYFFPPATQKFYIKTFSAINCFSLDSFIINVQKPISPSVLSPVHVCKGKFIDLYTSGGIYYLWKTKYNIQDTLVSNPQVFPDTSCIYEVKIYNDCFSILDSVSVIVDSLPKVTATNDTSIYRGAEIELTANTSAYNVEWSPESMINTNIFQKKINVNPLDTTLYHVRAIDGNGCIGYDSVLVSVYGKDVLFIPSGFSPNGDGINDVFRVGKYLNVKRLNYFEVYNRWGTKVYSSTEIQKGWDGTYNGELCPIGSYTWSIQVTNYENEKFTKSGSIELIR